MVTNMFTRSPQKSTRQAARESGLTRFTIQNVLKIELNFRPWKRHYCQDVSVEDCDHRKEIMLGWYEDWPQLFTNIIWSHEIVFHVGGLITVTTGHQRIREPRMRSHEAVLRLQCGVA
ncbi:hypothetical protein ANN_27297 [Periplaneta americana]|uniref:Uncharacterized protein n=1 Tax=Periplaneta americana TaxID=6978 RepID=A0ABQ8RXT5_PERAM|nr:hypothetical protein ANN_27297 [Periplaneta americana]